MKLSCGFLVTVVLCLFLGKLHAQTETNAPYRTKFYKVTEISKNLYELQGKIIKIKLNPYNIHQSSVDTYSCNIKDGNDVAIVWIPVSVGKEWFGKDRKNHPKRLFVLVTSGLAENKYGAKRVGIILKAVGVSVHKDIRGKISYKW